jgi:hypothetical protein
MSPGGLGGVGRRIREWLDTSPPHASDDPRTPYPTLEEIGPKGAFYLPQDHKLVRRHVESVSFADESRGRRRLTLDIALPREPDVAIATSESGCRFYVPIALMAKSPPTTNIDLLDEEGRSLPLLTKEQNADLTYAALTKWAEEVLGGPLSQGLQRALEAVVRDDDDLEAQFAFEFALVAASEEHPSRIRTESAGVFETVLGDLSVNSLLWLGLTGRPGARRIVKLRYDIPVELPPIPRRRPRTMRVLVETQRATHEFTYVDPGDAQPYSTIRRVWRRLTNTLGWSPIELSVDSPYVRGAESYHMQVDAPSGLEARSIELLEDPAATVTASSSQSTVTRSSAHLYLTGVLTRTISLAVWVRLGVGRRGFISLALLSSLVTAGLLWAFWARAEELKQPGVAAAILLIVPAILATFSVRPQEHALAGRVLSGVRFLLLASALLAAAASAALIEIRPDAWSVKEAWLHYAWGASGVAGLLCISWLSSIRLVWRTGDRLTEALSRGRRFFGWSLAILLFGASVAVVGLIDVDLVERLELLVASLLAFQLVSSFVLAAVAERAVPGRSSFVLTAAVPVFGLAFATALGARPASLSAPDLWSLSFAGLGVLTFLLSLIEHRRSG